MLFIVMACNGYKLPGYTWVPMYSTCSDKARWCVPPFHGPWGTYPWQNRRPLRTWSWRRFRVILRVILRALKMIQWSNLFLYVFISPKTIGSWISWENMPKRSEEPRFGRKTRCRNVENHVFYSDFLVDVPLDQSNESTWIPNLWRYSNPQALTE